MAPVTRLVISHLIYLFADTGRLFPLNLGLEFILEPMRVIRGLKPVRSRFLAISWFLRLCLWSAPNSGSLAVLRSKKVIRIGFCLVERSMSLELVIRFQKISIHSVEESLELSVWEPLLVEVLLWAQYISRFEGLNNAFFSVRQELLGFRALSHWFDFQRFDIFFSRSNQTNYWPFLLAQSGGYLLRL